MKRTNVRFYFPQPDIYCSVSSSCDREGYLWTIKKK
uniref:Bim protein n=1 Tax=Siphoviridae sp. ct0Xn2 TaxID=2826267 RepID=A0A8S5MTD7_9CAUD|nr:MAG TPA: Bim protein [Siphoviridae sp. ct0Xn2]DAI24953.1 MAG TPA: Bim protein [Caudoviricetes sp.]DAW29431.1 MAG TPA: Bim protein [Caudoviricetes sp.]